MTTTAAPIKENAPIGCREEYSADRHFFLYPTKFLKWFERNATKLRDKYPGRADDDQLRKSAYADWCKE